MNKKDFKKNKSKNNFKRNLKYSSKGKNKNNENITKKINTDNTKTKEDGFTENYELKGMIGKGRFGEVYKGINKKSKEMRAIKIIATANNQDFDFKKYLNNELDNMKICSTNNENSVKYIEHFFFKDKFIIVMELCDNSLQKILDGRKKGFTCEQIFNIISQLNNTFKIMHENKIIHRDIKLDNILIKYKDNKINNNKDSNINFVVKLADYGISKQEKNTVNKTFMGAFETMAPEILEGKENYDNKCDLWSIGIIIYQLFFKKYPYEGTPVAIYNQINKFGREKLEKTNNENLDNLINSLLIREPEKRLNYEEYLNHPFFKGNNFIEGEIMIEEENKDVRIINSYEQWHDNFGYILDEFNGEYCNEEEFKKNCEIKINNELIPFSYFYKFKNKGK